MSDGELSRRGCAEALLQRLSAASQVIMPGEPTNAPFDEAELKTSVEQWYADQSGRLLDALVRRISSSRNDSWLWLVFTALAACYPTADELLQLRRALELMPRPRFEALLLRVTRAASNRAGTPDQMMDVLQDRVIVDVDFCARKDHHTGIQRVVRATMPHWAREHDIVLAAWSAAGGCLRYINEQETSRVLEWGRHASVDDEGTPVDRLVVPWNCRIVMPENPRPLRCSPLAAMATFTGNTLSSIGYDCIPVVSPEVVHPGLPQYFAEVLQVVKHTTSIAGISASATDEFLGFAQMLDAQGLPAPRVVEVMLAMEVPDLPPAESSSESEPLILSVGAFEPRKNQLGTLIAAERLWREGLHFQLYFVGGGGYRTEFDEVFGQLQQRGRNVKVAVKISDEELWDLYRRARFSVFTSLHEGYGLPVAESLGYGVPVITTNYGSTAEIAALGGAITVDPRNDEQLTAAMRRLLTDDDLVAELTGQALAAPRRSWHDYATDLWRELVEDGGRG